MTTPTHILWLPHGTTPAKYNRSIAARKFLRHDGMIEQFTETLPRRWWQLKAPTRIRIRRVLRDVSHLNCRCAMTEIKV